MQAAFATKGSVHGFATAVRGSPLSAPAPRVAPIVARNIRAEAAADKAPAKEAAPAAFVPPTLDSSWPSPIFGGSTGGLLRKAQVEEFYVITWEGKKEQIFEMPTGKMLFGGAGLRGGETMQKMCMKMAYAVARLHASCVHT